MTTLLSFGLGALAWSQAEYLIHRFIGHGRRRAPRESVLARLTPAGIAAEFNREHLAHHADPSYFAPTGRKAAAAAVALPMIALAAAPLVGPRRAIAFAGGFLASYALYEVLHRRVHTHRPRGRYGRWLRRHHLLHHHRSPRANHGVTTPLWDRLLATDEPLERVRVPRRSPPAWLVDPATGEVRAEHAADYELVGRLPGEARHDR